MADELITIENVSKDLLKSIFDTALMDVSFDSDGDILINEQIKCFVILDKEKRRINLLSQFTFKPTAQEYEKLKCANQINERYLIIRAVVHENRLRFTYDLNLDGGVTHKALVLLVKRFCSIPRAAVLDLGKELVE
jgi:hypothetical protein